MRKTLFTHGQVYNLDQVKELNKLIQLETNKQLNQFSRIYFNKSKINYSINEN